MIYKSLSIALASIATASGATSPSYASITTGSEAKSAVGLKVFDGRGYYDFIQSQADIPTLHRVTTTSDSYAARQPFAAPTGFTGANVHSLDYISDFSVPNVVSPTLFAGWYTDVGIGTVAAYQGVKRTSLSQWSEVQTLSPPAEYDYHSWFGKSIAVDQKSHRKLAVGCSGCNATAGAGQIYIYSPLPSGLWSQSQVLAISANGHTHLGGDVQFHDNVLLSSLNVTSQAGSKEGYATFVRGSKPEDPFSLQQILTLKDHSITAAAVYEETIILASERQNKGSVAQAGLVYVLYPSTEDFHLKPAGKPRPVQWSVQQVLQATTPGTNNHFGGSVSINRNTLVVTEEATNTAYIFRREQEYGQWSQQQVLTSAAPVASSIAGSKLAVGGSVLSFYNLDQDWKCLVLSLEDQFGDGWDIAELIVTAPDGTQDYFSQSCELDNPLQIRYCPNLASDGGIYSFSIPGSVKSKFYWELQWGVFDERTATWYRGQWDTKMDFHWDPQTLSFSSRRLDKVLPINTTCGSCKTRPTEKPTPVVRRLKGAGGTQHPTISPAPTLDVSSSFNWRYLNLKTTSGNPWFDKQYQGTNYYVSDAHGHKLISSGTLCESELSKQCWLDLPNGEYILRVSGALNSFAAAQSFTYCKGVVDKGTQHQMTFRVADDDCSIVTLASQAAVCQSLGITLGPISFYLVLNVNMVLYGTALSTITNAERSVFSSAVSSLFPGMTSSDVTLLQAIPSGSSTLINANIRLSNALGYNLLDIDQEIALESFLKDTFNSQDVGNNLAVAFLSGSVASSLSAVSRAEFVDYRIVDSMESTVAAISDQMETVTTFADETTTSTSESVSSDSNTSSLLFETATAGYLLAGVGILFIVGFFVGMSQNKENNSQSHNNNNRGHNSGSGNGNDTDGRRDLSQMTTILTPKDLNELSRMENDYLKIMSK